MSSSPGAAVARVASISSDSLLSVLPPSPSSRSPFAPALPPADDKDKDGAHVETIAHNADIGEALGRHVVAARLSRRVVSGRRIGTSLVSLLTLSSAVALTKLVPRLHGLANSPIVAHVATSADHSDVLALRSSGWILLHSSTAQQAYDHAIVAAKLAISAGKAVLHFFDLDHTEAGDRAVVERSEDELRSFFGQQPLQLAHFANGNGNGAHSAATPTASTLSSSGSGASQASTDDTAETVEDVSATLDAAFAAVSTFLGRTVAPFTFTGAQDARDVVVVLGSDAPALSAYSARAQQDARFATLVVHLVRPSFPARLVAALPPIVERIAVLEQSAKRTTRLGPLFVDVFAAFQQSSERRIPHLVNGVLGAVTAHNVAHVADVIAEALKSAKAPHGFVAGDVRPSAVEGASGKVQIPKHEAGYTKMLDKIFGSRLQLVNSPDEEAAPAHRSPEFAFGQVLAQLQKRDALVDAVRRALASGQVQGELHAALSEWLLVRDDADKSAQVAEKVRSLLQTAEGAQLGEVKALESHLAHKSRWIVGSDAWSYDVGFSGLHHVIASGKNVNVLVIDSLPYTARDAADPSKRKKDVGLYAMNHGDVYVASTAVYSDYTQVLHALIEADKYDGPSVVLAYVPYRVEDAPALEVLKETKLAVDSGYWPLYRWDPSADKAGREPFQLDSQRIKNELKEFLDRQNYLTQLVNARPELSATLAQSEGTSLKEVQKRKAREAYEKMIGAMDGPPLLVLYASDGGNAEKRAKKLADRAKRRGLATRCLVMDDFPLEDLPSESHVAFVTSTAGQGEPPQNGREAFKALMKGSSAPKLEGVKFTVFAMGDSHYWPRPEDAHYYNKPGKDLDARLEALGGERMADLGLGDDQDADGPETGYKPWEAKLWKAMGVDSVEVTEKEPEAITNEHMKIASNYLRGTIKEGLEDTTTGRIAESDTQLTKFHGTYMQDDRDVREERKNAGLEPAYAFMIRCRLPGGVCTPEQWLRMDEIADKHGNHTFKLTTRQTFQFHGVVKSHLKSAMQDINKSLIDTIAACGDVNRNVMCSANPTLSPLHADVQQLAKALSEHLRPNLAAYHEIWLDKKMVFGEAVKEVEPLYGPAYLPRKHKVALAIPPVNDVDVFAHDQGYIAIVDPSTGRLDGFNVSIGGGMGVTHSMKKTYPRLGTVIGFVKTEQVLDVAEKIMLVQRDFGDRKDRKQARLKYTVDRLGVENYVAEVERRLGYKLEPAREFKFERNVDKFGWEQGHDGNWHFTMFIENGRVADEPEVQYKSGMREVAKRHKGTIRLTANQHLILSDVRPEDLDEMKAVLKEHGLDSVSQSKLRHASSACVAFPTCGLAMAESERYLPQLVTKVEKLMEEVGVDEEIVMRMTGCPNGCARPWLGEIAFVGKAPGQYLMLLGGGYAGERLNKIYKENVNEQQILETLRPILKSYALDRLPGEHFGDFVVRKGIIKATTHGTNFYDHMAPGDAVQTAA